MNKTLVEKVRCMLSNTRLGKFFEVVTYAQHLVYHFPSSVIGGKTPLEVYGLENLQLIMILCIFLVLLHIIM